MALPTILSLLVFLIVALLAGALYLWRRPGHRRQAVLMLVLAAVVAVNVAIWTLPYADGGAPATQELR